MRKLILALLCLLFVSSSATAKDWEAVLAMLEQQPQTRQVIKKQAEACSNLAVEAYQKKDKLRAAKWLKRAAKLDPTGGHQKRLVEILMKENKSVLDRAAKKEEARQMEADFSKSTDKHFSVTREHTIDSQTDAAFCVGMITARKLIAQDLKFKPHTKTKVRLYSSAEFSILHNGRPCSHDADVGIRLALDSHKNLKPAIATFFHEYTHTAIDSLTRKKCPTWLNEGLSQVQEFKIKKRPLTALKEAAAAKQLLTLEELDDAFTSSDSKQVALGYQQSYKTAAFMTEVFGYPKIRSLLKELGRGQPLEIALRKSCGVSVQQLESGWKAWYLK